MICPNCQADNPCEAKFCMNCGNSLVVTCPNCNFQNIITANFCMDCGTKLKDRPAPAEQPRTKSKEETIQQFIPKDFANKLEEARKYQTMKGERRIVSILFCDVKGSTSMAEKLDPEEWAEIMNQAFEYLISPIYTYEGTLARLMGDSILAFFGAPIGHEDDAQRAILAGLKIVKDIQPFKAKINRKYNLDFDVRVGINTGLVVVGGVGSDMFMEYTALGDAINIAARMEQTAPPSTVQVGQDTYKQTVDYFEFEERGGVEVKGKSDPVKAYRVLGLKDQPTNGRNAHSVNAAMVGRSAEMNILGNAIDHVMKGHGQIVCVVGEAGLGKSRLLNEACQVWEARLPDAKPFGQIATRWNQASGLSYESSRPYGLIQRLIRNYIGLAPNDKPEQVKEQLSKTLAMIELEVNQEWLDLFEFMLGVSDQQQSIDLSGETLKHKIYTEMKRVLEVLAKDGPTVLALDDLHWSDPASAEFLVHIFQLAEHLPILYLCSFRPHHESQAWMVKQKAEMNYAHRYTQINLLPLSDVESSQLVHAFFDGGELPDSIRRMVLRKSDGNPFFMEEVIRTLIDEQVIVHDENNGHWKKEAEIDDISIPDNLSAFITARIDRLEESTKHVLQMAAVVGRNFDRRVLEAVNDLDLDLDQELSKLQQMGLVLEVGQDPDMEFTFRQALTQETAYNTILIKHRRNYHLKAGEAILKLYPERAEEFSSLLGHHFYQARDPRALEHFKIDGDTALQLYANVEAINYYSKAIEVANWQGDPALEDLAYLYLQRGRAYELDSQFSAALDNYEKLEKLAANAGNDQVELSALIAQAQIYSVPSSEFNMKLGRSIIGRAKEIAEAQKNKEALAKIYWISMNLERFTQNLETARQAGEKAIALARELNMDEQLAFSLNDASHAFSMNGEMERAKEVSLEASQLWKKLNNLPMLADSLATLSAVCVYTGEFDQAYQYSDEAYSISQSINNVWGLSYSRYAIGIIDLERGEISAAIEHLEQTILDAQKAHFRAGELLARTFLSIVYSEIGAYSNGTAVLEEGQQSKLGSLAVSRAFSFGAGLLVQVKARNLEAAEKLIENYKDETDSPYFVAEYYFKLGQCYLYLEKGDYKNAIDYTTGFMNSLTDTGALFLNAELLMILGIAHLEQQRLDDAKTKFQQGLEAAENLGSRKVLWQINYHLGRMYLEQRNAAEANAYFQQAKKNVEFILDHIQNSDLRSSFLDKPQIQELFKLSERISSKGGV